MKVVDLWGDTGVGPHAKLILKWVLNKFDVDWILLLQYNFQLLDFMNTETNLPILWQVPVKTIWSNVKKDCVVLVIWCYIPAPECKFSKT